MRDTGPEDAKASIENTVDQFLDKTDSDSDNGVPPVDIKAPQPVQPGLVSLNNAAAKN
jgi:hypothetical protein